MNYRTVLRAAAISGVIGVALGAFGAHALKDDLLARGTASAWETAVRYHLLHAIGLLCIAVWLRQRTAAGWPMAWAARSWIMGTILFSGSLYGLALGGPRWLGPITPIGGVGFIAGWLLLLVAASLDKE